MSPPEDSLVLFRRASSRLGRNSVHAFARTLRDEVAGGRPFQCLITDDRELRRLNAQFLGKDYPTDVLSFPYNSPEEPAPLKEQKRGPRAGVLAAAGTPANLTRNKLRAPARIDSPAPDPRPPAPRLLGEIAISVQRAAEQAAEFGHGLDDEVRILMLHGVLHLMGMDHETDRGRMRRAETAWRRKLGLPAGLIERVRS